MEYLNKVDWDVLNTYINEGYITTNKHPDYDIWVLNYTPKTQAKKYWDLYTLSCRGLIVDDNGNILARPFQKFKNLEEHDSSEINMNQKFEIFEKMDGSFIILFYYYTTMEWIVASRGSFISEQAMMAKKMISRDSLDILNKDNTYLFEILYMVNRIVVDYGDREELILLGVINTKTGRELCYNGMYKKYSNYFKIVDKINITDIDDLRDLRKLESTNREGFVIRFQDGFRVKVKFEEYVRLHRILTNVSNKTVWEHLKNKHDFDELLDKVPDEFYDWLMATVKDFKYKYFEIEKSALKEFIHIYYFNQIKNRKEFALEAKESKYRSILFNIYDVKEYDELIWRMIKPDYSKPFSDGYSVF